MLDDHDRIVRQLLQRRGGVEIKTTGDGFHASLDGATRAVRCAQAITRAMRPLDLQFARDCTSANVSAGARTSQGLTVHVAARVGALAGPNEVLVTSDVKDFVEVPASPSLPRPPSHSRACPAPGTCSAFSTATDGRP